MGSVGLSLSCRGASFLRVHCFVPSSIQHASGVTSKATIKLQVQQRGLLFSKPDGLRVRVTACSRSVASLCGCVLARTGPRWPCCVEMGVSRVSNGISATTKKLYAQPLRVRRRQSDIKFALKCC